MRYPKFADRTAIVRKWLESYNVFQSFTVPERNRVTRAILRFADAQPKRLAMKPDSIIDAHTALVAVCQKAYGKKRDFTSLASKALWLRYPKVVPLYDRMAQNSLFLISKIEPDLPAFDGRFQGGERYAPFVKIWCTLYKRYSEELEGFATPEYPYAVRILDRILWLLGEPTYGPRRQ